MSQKAFDPTVCKSYEGGAPSHMKCILLTRQDIFIVASYSYLASGGGKIIGRSNSEDLTQKVWFSER